MYFRAIVNTVPLFVNNFSRLIIIASINFSEQSSFFNLYIVLFLLEVYYRLYSAAVVVTVILMQLSYWDF